MAGHNKWSKIKHKKAITDAVKSKTFSKYSRLIQMAVKNAGGDINSSSVQTVLEAAKKENVPKDVIERAIKKASGAEAENLQEVLYEGYSPNNIGILVKAVTDNTNRTLTDVKTVFTKNGGVFASSGAVSWAFELTEDRNWKIKEDMENLINSDEMEKLDDFISLLEEIDEVTDIYHGAKTVD